jgi:hypothetical protein
MGHLSNVCNLALDQVLSVLSSTSKDGRATGIDQPSSPDRFSKVPIIF